jgi:hypothetical protein
MKLLGAYIPATAAIGFTTESAVYCGNPVSAPPASSDATIKTEISGILILGADLTPVFSIIN